MHPGGEGRAGGVVGGRGGCRAGRACGIGRGQIRVSPPALIRTHACTLPPPPRPALTMTSQKTKSEWFISSTNSRRCSTHCPSVRLPRCSADRCANSSCSAAVCAASHVDSCAAASVAVALPAPASPPPPPPPSVKLSTAAPPSPPVEFTSAPWAAIGGLRGAPGGAMARDRHACCVVRVHLARPRAAWAQGWPVGACPVRGVCAKLQRGRGTRALASERCAGSRAARPCCQD